MLITKAKKLILMHSSIYNTEYKFLYY